MAGKQEKEKEKERKKAALQSKYSKRITIAKNAREYFQKGDYVNATKFYIEYLNILAHIKDLDDIYQLKPAHFDSSTHVTELLLISHVYWELSRTYEMTPKLQPAFQKALAQFVLFTVNQPYQVFNSEMLRKYIKKNKKRSSQIAALREAFMKIQVNSKKCYIATELFGAESIQVRDLRKFKQRLLKKACGTHLISTYYRVSHSVVLAVRKNRLLKVTLYTFLKPIIYLCWKSSTRPNQDA